MVGEIKEWYEGELISKWERAAQHDPLRPHIAQGIERTWGLRRCVCKRCLRSNLLEIGELG